MDNSFELRFDVQSLPFGCPVFVLSRFQSAINFIYQIGSDTSDGLSSDTLFFDNAIADLDFLFGFWSALHHTGQIQFYVSNAFSDEIMRLRSVARARLMSPVVL